MGAIDKERLIGLLEQERMVLLEGDYAELDGLGARKDKLVTGASAPLLQELLPLFERNHALLAAAIDGFASAKKSRTARMAARETLQSYTSCGSAKTITSGASGLVKRA